MFSLESTDFALRAPSTLQQLWRDQVFTDVTLVTVDDKQIEAHKAILSSASGWFQQILVRNPHQKPLIYLGNVDSERLEKVLQFMYLGQVKIACENAIFYLSILIFIFTQYLLIEVPFSAM